MAAHSYKVREGSLQDRFDRSRKKIQIYAGAFANGKTSASVVLKALKFARDYPGSNGLIARSTYPKLNDTIRAEFFKWCPKKWIKRKPTKDDNTCILTNDSIINFRYIAQQGKTKESSTSNLLSANYDWIIVDQIEDPEITYKDFNDLLGRLRGSTPYMGQDSTMPRTGPRWFVITANPTRNWFYKKIVRPYHQYQRGILSDDLLVDNSGEPIVDIFEGSTYENAENLEPDYIETLEAAYRGQMRERFLLGQWGAYEGLVHPEFDETVHVINHDLLVEYFFQQQATNGVAPIEGYDFGLISPSCYLFGFQDKFKNIIFLDGFYEAEAKIEWQANEIKSTWARYGIEPAGSPNRMKHPLYADPQIFKRTVGDKKVVGVTTAQIFAEEDIVMKRAANTIQTGIVKINGYMGIQRLHRHPIFGTVGAPYIYFSSNLQWLINEADDYYWRKDTEGEYEDVPVDRNDHAMNALKYALTKVPSVVHIVKRRLPSEVPAYMRWSEYQERGNPNAHRYVNG